MSVNIYDSQTKRLKPIAGCPADSPSGKYSPMDELLAEPTSTDIDGDVITCEMEEGTAVTVITSVNGVDTITTTITMNEGNYDYVRTTTITKVNGVDQIRTTLEEIPKS